MALIGGPTRGRSDIITNFVTNTTKQVTQVAENVIPALPPIPLSSTPSSSSAEMRIRLTPLPSAFKNVLGNSASSNILTPLIATNGMIFPYAPQITLSQDVIYADIAMVHTNGDVLAYQRTPSVSINIAGKFTIQNQNEGKYALAALHFMRTVSKMYFGELAGKNAGLPPPILLLNGYGKYVFNNLRVILKSHSYTYSETMDTVVVNADGGSARLPVVFDLSLTLIVQQTPRTMRKEFDLDKFRTGELMSSIKGGWI